MAVRVIVLNGSPRKGGNTDMLSDRFIAGATRAGAECEKVYLDDFHVRPPAELGDIQAERVDLRADDDHRTILDKLIVADVLVLASPVYWQGVSAQMKCFIDRFSCHYAQTWFNEGMRGKVWAVLTPYGASHPEEAEWVTRPVQVWVSHFKGTYAGEVAVSTFRKGAVCEKPEALAAAEALGRTAVEMARKSTG